MIGLLSAYKIGNFGKSLAFNSEGLIKRVSLIKQSFQTRPKVVNINSDKTFFYPFPVSVKKCGLNSNTIDDPYGRVCFPNIVRNMNVKVFNLMSGVNETRFLAQHESCECKSGLNESICYSKQKWNRHERRCECKELDD